MPVMLAAMPPAIRSGSFIAFPVRKDLFSVCRVGKVSSACMMVEVKDWFGSAPPELAEVAFARVLDAAPRRSLRAEPLRFLVLSGKPPRGGVVVGYEPKLKDEPVPYSIGLSWKRLAEQTLAAWAHATKQNPKRVLGAEKRAAAKRRGVSVAMMRLEENAKEVLREWREGGYDNLKDAILDSRELVAKTEKALPVLGAKLQKMHDLAVKRLAKLAQEDPAIARYARGLLPESRRR